MLAMSSVDQAGGIDYAHTDGWAAAAPGTNPRPDFFFLVCEEWDPTGGESFLVDGQGVFESLPPALQAEVLGGSGADSSMLSQEDQDAAEDEQHGTAAAQPGEGAFSFEAACCWFLPPRN